MTQAVGLRSMDFWIVGSCTNGLCNFASNPLNQNGGPQNSLALAPILKHTLFVITSWILQLRLALLPVLPLTLTLSLSLNATFSYGYLN